MLNRWSKPKNLEWEDILGTGRLHIKRISDGSGEKVNRTSAIKIQISTPVVPFDIKFGSSECELKTHSTLEVKFWIDKNWKTLDTPASVDVLRGYHKLKHFTCERGFHIQ